MFEPYPMNNFAAISVMNVSLVKTDARAPVTRLDREAVIVLLNQALAAGLVCMLRYRRHHFMARAVNSPVAAREFMAHADQQLDHTSLLAERIVQLGGAPDFSLTALAKHGTGENKAAGSLASMIRENLIAADIAIESYRGLLQYVDVSDSTTHDLLQSILSVEEDHADQLSTLLVSGYQARARLLATQRQSLPALAIPS